VELSVTGLGVREYSLSDNYFDLAAGESRRIALLSERKPGSVTARSLLEETT
jgi:hypothetical protein